MNAGTPLIVQYDFRQRLNDLVGLGLLTLATLLSFTGLVELSRNMHPIRFVLVLCTAVCSYRVLTKTFACLRFTDSGIECRCPLRKAEFRRYDQLAEIGGVRGKALRLRFNDGSVLTIDPGMRNASDLLVFLQQRARHLTIPSA